MVSLKFRQQRICKLKHTHTAELQAIFICRYLHEHCCSGSWETILSRLARCIKLSAGNSNSYGALCGGGGWQQQQQQHHNSQVRQQPVRQAASFTSCYAFVCVCGVWRFRVADRLHTLGTARMTASPLRFGPCPLVLLKLLSPYTRSCTPPSVRMSEKTAYIARKTDPYFSSSSCINGPVNTYLDSLERGYFYLKWSHQELVWQLFHTLR